MSNYIELCGNLIDCVLADKTSVKTIEACYRVVTAIENLHTKNRRLQAEHDAALKDLKKVAVCGTCTHYCPNSRKQKCSIFRMKLCESNYAGCTKWQWRGAQEGAEE